MLGLKEYSKKRRYSCHHDLKKNAKFRVALNPRTREPVNRLTVSGCCSGGGGVVVVVIGVGVCCSGGGGGGVVVVRVVVTG